MSVGHGIIHGSRAGLDAGGSSARRVERRSGGSDLRARTRCGHLCLVGVEQATGRGTRSPSDAQHALGHDSRLRKAAGEVAKEAAGGENGPSRQSATCAGSHRSARNARAAVRAPPEGWSADETGWRVNGKTDWLWCLTTRDLTYYLIDRSRAARRC